MKPHERDRLRLNAGKTPVRAPPPLQAGQARRSLKRISGETSADAIARAQDMPWWDAVVQLAPAHTALRWVWTVDIEPAEVA